MSITVQNLSFAYGEKPVLRNVSFALGSGRLLAVLGSNGAGKTTLFRCILGLQRHYGGTILLDGVDASALGARELAQTAAYIPQTQSGGMGYTVLDMALMGAASGLPVLRTPGQKERERAMGALARLGVERLAYKGYDSISGGERQLVLIARALAQRAKILLMDEPTASLDYGNQSLVLSAVRALARQGCTVALSTHNPQHALWYADAVLALSGGKTAAFGSPAETVTPALMKELYGVEAALVQTEYGPLLAPALVGGQGHA